MVMKLESPTRKVDALIASQAVMSAVKSCSISMSQWICSLL